MHITIALLIVLLQSCMMRQLSSSQTSTLALFMANKPRKELEISSMRALLKDNSTSGDIIPFLCVIKQDNGNLLLRRANEAVMLTSAGLHSEKEKRVRIERVDSILQFETSMHRVQADAIFGIFELPLGCYLGVVTKSSHCPALGDGAREVKEIDLIQIGTTPIVQKDPTLEMMKDRQTQALSILTEIFSAHSFYYSVSPSNDVTRNTQSNILQRQRFKHIDGNNAFLYADERFFWNLNASFPFIESGLGHWVTPMCNIWTDNKTISVGTQTVDLFIVSRRGSKRQGPRYIKRGIDSKGDVANFVETEQILRLSAASGKTQGDTFSFVQVRGSIPLFWEQNEVWKLRPQIIPERNISASLTPLLNHVSALFEDYVLPRKNQVRVKNTEANIIFVNLIDKTGAQGELGKFFVSALRKISGMRETDPTNLNRTEISQDDYHIKLSKGSSLCVKHIWFDYHKMCAKGKTSNIGQLISILEPSLAESTGYFHLNGTGAIVSLQRNIIRTNCVDCLDRTNVVQTAIARRVLSNQLKGPFILHKRMNNDSSIFLSPFSNQTMEQAFRELWGDNGDKMSMLYAGTRALKRDVTRVGKRTRQGMLDDGVNSAKRYFINNLKDPCYQKGIDILLGKISDRVSPFLKLLRSKTIFKSKNGKLKTKIMKVGIKNVGAKTMRKESSIVDNTPKGPNINSKQKKMVLSKRSDNRQHSVNVPLPAINHVGNTKKTAETQYISMMDQIDRMFDDLILTIKQNV